MRQKNNFNLYISIASLLVAVLSVIFAFISNDKAEKAVQLAREANEISTESNLISREANKIAIEANTLMENSNRIQLLNTGKTVSSIGGPSLVAPEVWHCGTVGDEGIIMMFDFGMDLRNSSEKDISLINMGVDVVGVGEVKEWNLYHYDNCGRRKFIPAIIPAQKEENWYFIAFAQKLVGESTSLEKLLDSFALYDTFQDAKNRNIRINLEFDDDSQTIWEAPIAYIAESYQYDYWSDLSCSELAEKVVAAEAYQSSFDPNHQCH